VIEELIKHTRLYEFLRDKLIGQQLINLHPLSDSQHYFLEHFLDTWVVVTDLLRCSTFPEHVISNLRRNLLLVPIFPDVVSLIKLDVHHDLFFYEGLLQVQVDRRKVLGSQQLTKSRREEIEVEIFRSESAETA